MQIPVSEEILLNVQKPARYIGCELNSVKKNWEKIRTKIALVFPDIYEVGMSHLGLKILYHLLNDKVDVLCERAFSVGVDFEKILREKNIPLYSLESYRPLSDFDILGFSLSYELTYTNVLNILDLAKIPLFSKDREEKFPLIIAGGECSFNPEPLSHFIDAFVVGEGEEVILEIIEVHCRFKENKHNLLFNLAKIPGVYVPLFYEVEYFPEGLIKKIYPREKKVPDKIKKRYVNNLNDCYFPTSPIVPFLETVHDRLTVEIMRGCPNRCHFCRAGKVSKPVRPRSQEKILEIAKRVFENTGWEEISLLSLSSGDYPHIEELIEKLVEEFYEKKVAISIPSLRLRDMNIEKLAEKIKKIKKTGFTLVPEVATEKMRKVINKNISEEEIIQGIKSISKLGWRNFKLYFMIGLPEEGREDVLAISQMLHKILSEVKGHPIRRISVSISSFVPKPHTTFERERQLNIFDMEERQNIVLNNLSSKKLEIRYHNASKSFIEGVLSRGDRNLNNVLYSAFKLGCKFDAWQEHFNFDVWMRAFKENNISPEFYLRKRDEDEILPWEHIEIS